MSVPAGWLSDPLKRHQYRYWDGAVWSDHVADNGVTSLDPIASKSRTEETRAASGSGLSGRVQNALSSHFASGLRGGEYKNGMKRLAQMETKILGSLSPNEDLRLVTPGYTGSGFDSVGVITSHRVIQFYKHHTKDIRLVEIAETERSVDSHGYFSLLVIANDAIPYASWRHGPLGSDSAASRFWSNCLPLHMSTPAMLEEFDGALMSGRSAPTIQDEGTTRDQ